MRREELRAVPSRAPHHPVDPQVSGPAPPPARRSAGFLHRLRKAAMPPPVSVPAHELLTIRVTVAPPAVVTAAGEVDSCSAPLLAAALQAAADQARAGTEILADLSAVTFLDSAGVHVLADAHRRVTA